MYLNTHFFTDLNFSHDDEEREGEGDAAEEDGEDPEEALHAGAPAPLLRVHCPLDLNPGIIFGCNVSAGEACLKVLSTEILDQSFIMINIS